MEVELHQQWLFNGVFSTNIMSWTAGLCVYSPRGYCTLAVAMAHTEGVCVLEMMFTPE